MILGLYRAAWEPALWAIRLCAGLESIMGGKLLPARWHLSDRLTERMDTGSANVDAPKTLWLHAASLGECKGLWAFAQTLRAGIPADTHILLTCNTTTGLDFLRAQIRSQTGIGNASNTLDARLAPLDHPRLAKQFLRNHNVRALVLFEVELWPHWIFAAGKKDVPVFWISARLTARARRRYAGSASGNSLRAAALRRVLGKIRWIQTQTLDDADVLRALGGRNVETGADLRGLYYLQIRKQGHAATRAEDAARRGTAFVSLHADELTALLPKITAAGTELPIRIFPRKQNERSSFVKALAPHGFVLYSQAPDATRVIVDSFGRVTETLAQARIAVIGGSYGKNDRIGGHNLWEPLLAGARIEIGPHHDNQKYLADKIANENAMEFNFANEEFLLNRAATRAGERLLKGVNTP